jgi:hypothetical protein
MCLKPFQCDCEFEVQQYSVLVYLVYNTLAYSLEGTGTSSACLPQTHQVCMHATLIIILLSIF